jgi:tetratricopeptide (TPR) repeat protein
MGLPMMLRAGPLALLVALILQSDAMAQVVVGPYPGDPGYGGVRFFYHRGGLTISGGMGAYPSGAYYLAGPGYPSSYYAPPYLPPSSAPRITINNYYNGYPPVLGGGYADDLRGYDLDVVPPKKTALPNPIEPVPKQVDPPPFKGMPGVDVSVGKLPVRPEDVKAMPKDPGPKPDVQPKADPREENARLVELGLLAFAAGEYGLAAQRFRQATQVEPRLVRAYFLQAQAEFALGKYRDAVMSIHAGMKLGKLQWPLMIVQPRVDIYKDRAADFDVHLKRLDAAVTAQPNNSTLLFLMAHQLWFDGQRKDALALFQRAKPLTKDATYIDAFLLIGGPGQIAAK